MDLKQEAARTGATLIREQKKVGLGEGSTIAFLVAELKTRPVVNDRTFYSSSEKTKRLLADAGFQTGELSGTTAIDIYFDGCDQLDHSLNALKSGAGIHTMEKLLASMASEFILLADESKYVSRFDGKFPLVVELIPEAFSFVRSRLSALAPGGSISRRDTGDLPVLTRHGNWLIDCGLPDWGKALSIGAAIKQLTGVVDTSLFTGLCKRAVIAGFGGGRIVVPQ